MTTLLPYLGRGSPNRHSWLFLLLGAGPGRNLDQHRGLYKFDLYTRFNIIRGKKVMSHMFGITRAALKASSNNTPTLRESLKVSVSQFLQM